MGGPFLLVITRDGIHSGGELNEGWTLFARVGRKSGNYDDESWH